jgi:hypothetical protein
MSSVRVSLCRIGTVGTGNGGFFSRCPRRTRLNSLKRLPPVISPSSSRVSPSACTFASSTPDATTVRPSRR